MADNALMMTFQNNCESINSNCVEVSTSDINEKITNNDIISTTKMETIENEANDEERSEAEVFGNDSEPVTATEDAVAEILAGDSKLEEEFKRELLEISSNDGIYYKTENELLSCEEDEKREPEVGPQPQEVEEEEVVVPESEPQPEEQPQQQQEDVVVVVTRKRRPRISIATHIARNLRRRSIKW